MTTMVRNNQTGPTTLSNTEGLDRFAMEWGGVGSKDGSDIQAISEAVEKHPAFKRAVQRGVLSIVTDEEANSAFSAQREAMDRASDLSSIMDSIDAAGPNNDLVLSQCLISGESVTVRSASLDTEPPLADRFKPLAGEFVQIETDRMDPETGQAVSEWVRMKVDANQKVASETA